MRLFWASGAWEDYLHWQQTDWNTARRINALIEDARRNPCKGLGKPEPLRGDLAGWWSRRITGEHRLVYRATETGTDRRLEIAACRYHY